MAFEAIIGGSNPSPAVFKKGNINMEIVKYTNNDLTDKDISFQPIRDLRLKEEDVKDGE